MHRSLSVLLMTHYYEPEIGAASRRMRSLVSRWRARGVDVRVIAPLPHYPHGRPLEGYGFRQIGTSWGRYGERVTRTPFLPTERGGCAKLADHIVSAAAALSPAMVGPRPDVVVATVPAVPTMGAALVAARRWRALLVLDMRDSWPDVAVEAGMAEGAVGRVLVRFVSSIQRAADVIVTVPPGFAEVLAARGIPAERIHHVPNGTDVDGVPYQDPPPQVARRLRVLYCGTHGVSQGLDTVVRAIAAVGSSRVEGRFIGEGTERQGLIELATSLEAPITFEEAVPRDKVWQAYAWADTCLVPLRALPSFKDAVPSKIYEIMASGRHVLACLEGEAKRVIGAARAGAVVPPENEAALIEALEHLACHRDELLVGEGPRAWVRANRDDDALADAFHDILTRAAAARRR
jgi:glycosyltransferase involved in cell wall biosynthesis